MKPGKVYRQPMWDDGLEIDWDAGHAEWAEIVRRLETIRYEAVDIVDPAVEALLKAIQATHVNGGAVFGQFRVVEGADVFLWSTGLDRIREYDFIRHFLAATPVCEALSQLQIQESLGQDLGFEQSWSGTLTLDGELAALLVHGGVYERFKGTADEAKALGRAFAEALVGERHTEFQVYRSSTPWTPWFFDVADWTWLLLDRRRAELTLLCVTDTD
jgi:hypothetical protein